MFNQQPAPDLAQFLQLRALNQLSMPGLPGAKRVGISHSSIMGMGMGMNPYGMPFRIRASQCTQSAMAFLVWVTEVLCGMTPAPSLAAIRAGLGGATDMPFRDIYTGVSLPGECLL
jgi:hypothetical protein